MIAIAKIIIFITMIFVIYLLGLADWMRKGENFDMQ